MRRFGKNAARQLKAGYTWKIDVKHAHVRLFCCKDGLAAFEMKGGTVQVAGDKIILRGSQVVLGQDATEPTLLGTTFTTLFNAHTHATAVGPSGPPLPPLIPMVGPHLAKAAVAK